VGQFIDPSEPHLQGERARTERPGAYMRPNLLSDISIQDMRNDSALVVPSRTVLQDVNGNNYVYVLDATRDDEAKARKVLVQRLSEYKGRISRSRDR
jgi:hypothetical protein